MKNFADLVVCLLPAYSKTFNCSNLNYNETLPFENMDNIHNIFMKYQSVSCAADKALFAIFAYVIYKLSTSTTLKALINVIETCT